MAVSHVVIQGEGISRIAYQYGFFPDTVWDHPKNSELRSRREDADALLPDDVIFVPDLTQKSLKVKTEARHRFQRRGVPALFEIQLFRGDSPRTDEPFRLVVDGVDHHGKTDAKGNLRVFVPPNARNGELWAGNDEKPYILRFGYLDPATEVVGIQKRLHNLGYPISDPPNEFGPTTREGIRAFQRRFGLPETGEIDDATRAKIVDVHDDISGFPPFE